jgi:hypothetical protein
MYSVTGVPPQLHAKDERVRYARPVLHVLTPRGALLGQSVGRRTGIATEKQDGQMYGKLDRCVQASHALLERRSRSAERLACKDFAHLHRVSIPSPISPTTTLGNGGHSRSSHSAAGASRDWRSNLHNGRRVPDCPLEAVLYVYYTGVPDVLLCVDVLVCVCQYVCMSV